MMCGAEGLSRLQYIDYRPKVNDMLDRFENVYELILCSDSKGDWLSDLRGNAPRSRCTERFLLMREIREGSEEVGRTDDDFAHRVGF